MAEKVTIMKLKVDLECEKCYKKVKKLLAKYPQIRDQKFEEKQNIVTITVVCCSPEKIRDKLCSKGGGSIKSIEIMEPPKPAEPQKKKEPEKLKAEADKPKSKAAPPEPEKKKEAADKPKPKQQQDPPKADKPKPVADKPPEPKPAPPPVKLPDPVPRPMVVPVGMCYGPCYEGVPVPVPGQGAVGPPLCYDGYYGRPVYDSYSGCGRPYYVSRCDQYLSEENASGCTIM